MRYVILMLYFLFVLAPEGAAQDHALVQEAPVNLVTDSAGMQEEAVPEEEQASLEDSDENSGEESVADQRRIPEEHWEAIQRDPDFRYGPPKEEKIRRSTDGGLSFLRILAHPAFRVLLFVLIGMALLWALLRVLAQSGLQWRGRRKRPVQTEETGLPDEDPAAHQLNALQAEAQARGDFRMAFRYRYLQVLRDLGEEGLIRPEADRTNWDYVRQLQGHALYEAFRALTRSFDQVWYGQYALTESLYRRLLQAAAVFDSPQKQSQA
jgi:hypothetical protein